METQTGLDSWSALLAEVQSLANRMRRAAGPRPPHSSLPINAMRTLECLDRLGPQTVPQIARTSLVSRQAVQIVVNHLLTEGCVAPEENPAHRRSALIRLTARGKATLGTAEQRQRDLGKGLVDNIPETELVLAATVLRRIRQQLSTAGQDARQGDWRGKRRLKAVRRSATFEVELEPPKQTGPKTGQSPLPDASGQSSQEPEEFPVSLL
jgi:DNA-binding MarR family transcriptional regulator